MKITVVRPSNGITNYEPVDEPSELYPFNAVEDAVTTSKQIPVAVVKETDDDSGL